MLIAVAMWAFITHFNLALPFAVPLPPLPFTMVTDYTQSLSINIHGVSRSISLNISPELFNYYEQKGSSGDLPSLAVTEEVQDYHLWVTPSVFTSFATDLRQAYPDDEDYTNAVLQILHQQTYVAGVLPHYSIVSLGKRTGDCDDWSIVATSLLKAVNIECVLFLYFFADSAHMNIGVRLSHAPIDGIYGAPYSVQGFWMAECTGQSGFTPWHVGELPDGRFANPTYVIPLTSPDNSPSPYPLSYTINGQGPPQTNYWLTIQTTPGGTTDPEPNHYSYAQNAVASVRAISADSNGWTLDYWKLDGQNVGNANPYSVIMNGNRTIQAVFKNNGFATITFHVTLNGSPLQEAAVKITFNGGSNHGTTDSDGRISFQVPKNAGSVHCEITYNSETRTVDVPLTGDQVTVPIAYYGGGSQEVLDWTWITVISGTTGLLMIFIPSRKQDEYGNQ
jgi:hypothetical protein